MDPLQEQFEQSVGDQFANWLSATTGEPCVFARRADCAPDLVYSYGGRELELELTPFDGHLNLTKQGVCNAKT